MKDELRKKYLDIRNNITNRYKKDNLIFNKIINNEMIRNAKTILIYVSYRNEVDTLKIVDFFLNKKDIAVPKVKDGKIYFYYIKSMDELKKGNFNILEPITNKIVSDFSNCISITPGICFSSNMYRIGYGGGYYDRFFQDKKIYKIGITYEECMVEYIDNDKYDIAMDEIITDKRVIKKRRKSVNN